MIDLSQPVSGSISVLVVDSTREISHKLALAKHIIQDSPNAIYDKLGVSSRVELALDAIAREDLNRPMGD